MPFSVVKSNSRGRFAEVIVNLNYIESIEPKQLTAETPVQVKILRGLYYVHLYSALEKVVNETVEQAILLIKDRCVKNKHYQTAFNVISLNTKMQGFKSCGYKEYFNKSIDIFTSVDSEESFDINNTAFSTNLQNVWHETIQQTLNCFGIKPIEFDPRVRLTINEVVDKRNAVAHGRENPATVGERHRSNVLRQKTQEIQMAVDLFVDAFETYISQKYYIKEECREIYAEV